MQISRFAKSVLLCGHLLAMPVYAQQQPVAGPIRTSDASKEFKRTPAGDWQTTVTRPDGSSFVFTYVPGTKVAPVFAVKLGRVAGQARFSYQYHVSNDITARQELATLFLNVSKLVGVQALPSGWVNERRKGEGSVVLRGPLMEGGVPSGIPPGVSLDNFILEGPVLPGVGEVRCRGNVSGAVEVPAGLSAAQYKEIADISKQATVSVPIIAPILGVGVGEPELQLNILLTRIGGHYVSAVSRYDHPYAVALGDAFEAVYKAGNSLRDPAMQAALQRVLEIAAKPVKDPWQQQMSDALQFSLQAVKDGLVPTPRLAEPGHINH